MEVRELRIGNWITEFTTAYPNGKNIQLTFISDEDDFENCRAIPLTSEILEKCGYKKSNISDYNILKLPGDNHLLEPEDGCINISDYGELITIEVAINYLHQLQNLYFALTNTELNVEL